MYALILTMILAVTTFRYLISQGWLPSSFGYVPELLSVVVGAYVLVIGMQSRFNYVRPVCWLIFGGLAIGLICGAIVNQLQPGSMIAGLRTYVRAIPFFFLPAVLMISQKQLKVQLSLLLAICAVQLPLAVQQRANTTEIGRARGTIITTGDLTFGTIMNPGLLSLFLIGAACVLVGFYLRGRISGRAFAVALIFLLLPNTLNETKAALILLPLAFLTVFYFGSRPGARLKNIALATIILAGFTAVFIPIYDHYMSPRWGYGIVDFFTMEGRVEGYLFKGTGVGDVEQGGGRLDGIIVGFGELSRDPARLFFGLGIANASDSALGPGFDGAYHRQFAHIRLNSFAYILLELGILGITLVLLLHLLVLHESVWLARNDESAFGALALGWTGVSVVIVFSLVYHVPTENVTLSYLYWYFSGLVMAYGARLRFDRARHVQPIRHKSGPAEQT